MSNTSNGPANKGSKFMMQILASPLVRDLVSTSLNDKLKWLSPLAENDYAEYSLNQDAILEAIGISPNDKDDLFDFWPKNQPQWDGIALGSSGTLYLFEAKSYPAEMESGCTASSQKSIDKITDALKEIANLYGQGYNELWLKKYYQFVNRLVFCHKLNQKSHLSERYDNVKLVFVNNIEDPTWDNSKKTTTQQWEKHYNEVIKSLGLKADKVKEHIIILDFQLNITKSNLTAYLESEQR